MSKAHESKPAIPPLPAAPKKLALPTPLIPPDAPALELQPRLPSLPSARQPAGARSQPIGQSGTYSLGEHPRNTSSTPPSPVEQAASSAPPAPIAPGAPGTAASARAAIVVSAITAALVSAGTVFAMSKARPTPAPASAAERVTVPELARVPAENIRSIVEAMGLHANIEERSDPTVTTAGIVIAQAPRAGTQVERGAHIAIVLATRASAPAPAQPTQSASPVAQPAAASALPAAAPAQSAQPAPAQATTTAPATGATPAAATANNIVVPSVLHLYASDARMRLASAGLTVGEVHEDFDEHTGQNRVLRQVPGANARVARGQSVQLWVNRE